MGGWRKSYEYAILITKLSRLGADEPDVKGLYRYQQKEGKKMYHTVDELETFDFSQAQIFEIREYRDQIIFELGYVTIHGTNSCNRDIRDMGTNALQLKLTGVGERTLTLEGYRLFDADGNPKGGCEDEVIAEENLKKAYQNLQESTIYSLEKKDGVYSFYLDTEERTYSFVIKAEHDAQEWERFMNKTPTY